MIDKLLSEIKEDKFQNFSTTSFKMKTDIWNFFNEERFKGLNCVEFGGVRTIVERKPPMNHWATKKPQIMDTAASVNVDFMISKESCFASETGSCEFDLERFE